MFVWITGQSRKRIKCLVDAFMHNNSLREWEGKWNIRLSTNNLSVTLMHMHFVLFLILHSYHHHAFILHTQMSVISSILSSLELKTDRKINRWIVKQKEASTQSQSVSLSQLASCKNRKPFIPFPLLKLKLRYISKYYYFTKPTHKHTLSLHCFNRLEKEKHSILLLLFLLLLLRLVLSLNFAIVNTILLSYTYMCKLLYHHF